MLQTSLHKLKRMTPYVLGSAIILIILLKIAFSNEPLLPIIKIVLALYWLFVIPGLFVGLVFYEEAPKIESVVVGFILGAAVIGILSYYAGLLGFHIKYHSLLFPPLIVLLSLGVMYWKGKK